MRGWWLYPRGPRVICGSSGSCNKKNTFKFIAGGSRVDEINH